MLNFPKTTVCALPLLALAGCFTIRETPQPVTVMSRPAETNVAVSVRGFEAEVLSYATVSGVSTVYVGGGWGWGGGWYGPGYWETVPVCATVAQPRATDFFRERAQARFEEAGWPVMAQFPDYLVEVKFAGPDADPGAFWRRALRVVGTLFFSDRAVATYRAKLKIYDNRTGRLLLTRDYGQTADESMWSPVPVFGPLAYERTSSDCLRFNCLAALTDRATADASSFLTGGIR